MELRNIKIADALRGLQKDSKNQNCDYFAWSMGICFNLILQGSVDCTLSDEWLEKALNFLNLNIEYPIPYGEFGNEHLYRTTENLWTGGYGENRRYLLDVLIQIAEGTLPEDFKIEFPF